MKYNIFYCALSISKHNKEIYIVFFEIKKPLICQAGSAEAFAGSSATGRKRHVYSVYSNAVQQILR
jgi:hypothetical protein